MSVKDAYVQAEKEKIPLPRELRTEAASQPHAASNGNVATPPNDASAPRGKAPKRLKEPEPWEREAHKLWNRVGWTQQEIAKKLSQDFVRLIDQPMVSRAVKKVDACDGNAKPATPMRVPKPRNQM